MHPVLLGPRRIPCPRIWRLELMYRRRAFVAVPVGLCCGMLAGAPYSPIVGHRNINTICRVWCGSMVMHFTYCQVSEERWTGIAAIKN